jgi:hypothetical protein
MVASLGLVLESSSRMLALSFQPICYEKLDISPNFSMEMSAALSTPVRFHLNHGEARMH